MSCAGSRRATIAPTIPKAKGHSYVMLVEKLSPYRISTVWYTDRLNCVCEQFLDVLMLLSAVGECS